jgi:cytochrome c-type biogenesis protein CcsB
MNKLFILIALLSVNTFANNYFCTTELESIPTLAGGRVKPLYVLASESLRFISGKPKVNDSAVVDFCLLSVQSLGLKTKLALDLKVEHVKSRKLLELTGKETISAKDALAKEDFIRSELMTLKLNDGYKKDLNKVFSRIQTYKKIISGQAWTVPIIQTNDDSKMANEKINFLTLPDAITRRRLEAAGDFKLYFAKAKAAYIKAEGDKYLTELTYKKLKIFSWAMLIVLAGIFAGVLSKGPKLLYSFAFLTLLAETIGIALRCYISGRAPITNMYETVIFSGYGALIIAILISIVKKEKIFVLTGLAYNFLCLLMITFANDMLISSISPLVPVLRDNFWLSTHVTTIIMSYAALALSWMLANIVIFKQLKNKLDKKEFNYYVGLIYTCIKFGVVLLAAGIILGGVWADYSWGRFWGWDPKETWSLIVLLIYVAILHGKYTNWMSNKRFVPLVAAAFLSVMMAWFGVNYILASGLHSYGFSQGGAVFLGTFFIIQILIIILGSLRSSK